MCVDIMLGLVDLYSQLWGWNDAQCVIVFSGLVIYSPSRLTTQWHGVVNTLFMYIHERRTHQVCPQTNEWMYWICKTISTSLLVVARPGESLTVCDWASLAIDKLSCEW